MIITDLDVDMVGPLGDKLLYDQIKDETTDEMTNRYCTLRRAIGTVLMFNGQSQQMPDAPKMDQDDKLRVFSMTQSMIESGRIKSGTMNLVSEEVSHIRKFGAHCLHAIVYGYVCESLKKAEQVVSVMEPPMQEDAEGIAMT